MGGVEGIADLRAEQLTGLPQLQIAVDREATARVGLTPGDVIHAIRIGLVGEEASQIWIGQRRFDLVVRLQDDRRDNINAIRSLLIDGHDGTRIPLGQLADDHPDVRAGSDPPRSRQPPHRRRGQRRRAAISAARRATCARALARELKLPAGYFLDVGGRVESQERATRALLIAIWRRPVRRLRPAALALGSPSKRR